MRIYIGLDDREAAATRAAVKSLRKVSNIEPQLLYLPKLQDQGLMSRPFDSRGGKDFDLISQAHQATRFALSRFLVPIICQDGFALFVDADVIFLRDPEEMLSEVNGRHAVSVVKHKHEPIGRTKMNGQVQEGYRRKNWSSVMLFNCNHAANLRLSLRDVNERPGRDLHGFYWLNDTEIGELSPSWNWLVGVQPQPPEIGIAHFTLGGPFIEGWTGGPYDDLWHKGAA